MSYKRSGTRTLVSSACVILLSGCVATGCGNTPYHLASPSQYGAKLVRNATPSTSNTVSRKRDVTPTSTIRTTEGKKRNQREPASVPVVDAAKWMKVDMRHKIIKLNLIAGWHGKNRGYNFNGYSNGDMIITVPMGFRIKAYFRNDDTRKHIVMVVPYSQRNTASTKTAFAGAESAYPAQGILQGKSQLIMFRASRRGQYAIVSEVPGDRAKGMWATLLIIPDIAPAFGVR